MKTLSITPIQVVEAIEPVLPFWEEALGYTRTIEVPHGTSLGFIALEGDGVEIMLQTRASLAADLPVALDHLPQGGAHGGGTILYVTTSDLAEVELALKDWRQLHPRRKTFYGAYECLYQDPAGQLVLFSERVN
jgi:hypothetical protein